MSEELEKRVAELEMRLDTLERAVLRLMARPEKTVVIEKAMPVQKQEAWLNGIPVNRGCEWPAAGEAFTARLVESAFNGGKWND